MPSSRLVTMARPRQHVCSEPGCPEITANRRCPEHMRATEQQRGSRQARGYGPEHDRLRRRWRPKVEAGLVDCARCKGRIWLGERWHLDHTDDRSGYLGPSHERCNTSAGGKAAHQT
jgi:hypothetical protein